jgi:probable addiction module antidote protein
MGKLTKDFKEYLHERLQEPGAIIAYLNAALEGGDPSTFLLALRYVAEARGIASVAAMADLNRESLYRMLSDQGNPRLSSMLSVLGALGVEIQLRPVNRGLLAQGVRDEVRPMLAAVHAEKGYIPELEDEHDSAYTREPEPAAA